VSPLFCPLSGSSNLFFQACCSIPPPRPGGAPPFRGSLSCRHRMLRLTIVLFPFFPHPPPWAAPCSLPRTFSTPMFSPPFQSPSSTDTFSSLLCLRPKTPLAPVCIGPCRTVLSSWLSGCVHAPPPTTKTFFFFPPPFRCFVPSVLHEQLSRLKQHDMCVHLLTYFPPSASPFFFLLLSNVSPPPQPSPGLT